MKRIGNIYKNVWNKENCKAAILEAAKNKKRRRNVKRILESLDDYAEELSVMLKNHTYRPSPYTVRWINDGIKQKRRRLAKPRFWPDQCVHHALDRVMAPVMLKGLYYYSTGSVKGRGEARSKKGIERFLKNHPEQSKYVYKMDIHHYYDSISHKEIKAALRKKIKDPEVLWLYGEIIDSYPRLAVDPENGPADLDKGIPIGIDPSRWLCNFLLQRLDHEIKHFLGKKSFLTRYVDDIVIIGPNKRKLHKVRTMIGNQLKKMKLTVKKNWQVFRLSSRPIDFLGYKFYKEKTTIRKTILKRLKRKIQRVSKMRKISLRNAAGLLSQLAYVKRSNSQYFREKYMKNIISKKRLRKVVSNERKIHRETERNVA